jgi:hypothetical protein
MKTTLGLAAMLSFFASGCHEHCSPDDTPSVQQHAGTIEVTGAVAGLVDGAEVEMLSAWWLTHCIPTGAAPFCFELQLPSSMTAGGSYDLALTDSTAVLPATETSPAELGVVSGTLTIDEFETYREHGGGGEGDADLSNNLLRAALAAELEFTDAAVSIQLEIDYEDRATLECYSHLL